ncbi:MAG: transcription termination/antitermination protein NusG [Puniceicoccales bacterium]|jgi:transcriptional antiterminator NusG|nr:transcription termination/antitermination protein NusG [Puniceicoccales bacterium]
MTHLVTNEPQWYALQVLSNQESKVKLWLDHIMETAGNCHLIREVLVPMERVVEIKNGKRLHRHKKLYPGYVFVHAQLYDDEGQILQEPWQLIRRTRGVMGFVSGENPVPLESCEVERIQGQMKASEDNPLPKSSFEIGDKVKINDGPFASSVGQIEAINNEQGKLTISVLLFGRSTPIEAEFGQVGPVDE